MGQKNLTTSDSAGEAGGKKLGRPKGSKNKLKKADQIALTNQFLRVSRQRFDKVLKTLFDQAEAGDTKAIRIIMDKVVPQAVLESEEHGGGQAPIILNITGIDSVSVNQSSSRPPSEVILDAEYNEVDDED